MTQPKITEATTLAELAQICAELGDPFLTILRRITPDVHLPSPSAAVHAIAYLPNVGSFYGAGQTVAEALNNALGALRVALSSPRSEKS